MILLKFFREPLIHFLLLGAAFYGAYGLLATDTSSNNERVVSLTAANIQALTDQWTRLWKRPPTEEELANIIRSHIRTQILYKEALAMQLDVGDPVIERRLAQKLEILSKSIITPAEPSDEVLKAWYKHNINEFKQPERYTLTHIFFDPDVRGENTLSDAKKVLAELTASNPDSDEIQAAGDRFMLQKHYPNRTKMELKKAFGSGFVDQVVKLEPNHWQGPILSGYGTHLVLISNIIGVPATPFDEVKNEVKQRWLTMEVDRLSELFIDNLISRYEIDVEEIRVPITLPKKDASS